VISTGYTKLFASIVASTIWREADHVRIVWITMLAMADSQDCVAASVPGLADLARVSIEQCEDAIKKLMSPDPYSRTKDNEGRRIAEIDGGWMILNRNKYRELGAAEDRREYKREYMREYMRQRRLDNVRQCLPPLNTSEVQVQKEVQEEGEKEKEKEQEQAKVNKSSPSAPPCVDDPDQFKLSSEPEAKKSKYHPLTLTVLGKVNEICHRKFRATEDHMTAISERLKEDGVTLDGIEKMLKRQYGIWSDDRRMAQYLRIETLFRKSKFGSYYDMRDLPLDATRELNETF